MDAVSISIAIFLGAVGLAFFLYGKRERLLVPVLAGVSLMACPYFVGNPIALGIVGVAITGAGYSFRHALS